MSRDRPEMVLVKAALWNGLLYLTWPVWVPVVVVREIGRGIRHCVRSFRRAGDVSTKSIAD